jgi:hypothetical protein
LELCRSCPERLHNDKQLVIGTVQVVPGAAALTAAKASVPHNDVDLLKILESLRVSRDSRIKNKQNVVVGTVGNSEIADCHGRYVRKNGQIFDSNGTLLAVAKLYIPRPETTHQPSRGSSALRAARFVSLETIAGAKIDHSGYVSLAGRRVAKVAKGTIEKLKLRHIVSHGRVQNQKNEYLGKVKLLEGLSVDLSRDDVGKKSGPENYDRANVSLSTHI